jgi:hypothetical protein
MMQVGKQSRARRVLSVAIICLAVTVVVVVVVFSDRHTAPTVFVCADVGLHGPSASTPEDALAAYVDANAGDGADWRRVGRSTTNPGHTSGIPPVESYSFMPRHRVSHPGFSRIIVSNRFGTWAASGAC